VVEDYVDQERDPEAGSGVDQPAEVVGAAEVAPATGAPSARRFSNNSLVAGRVVASASMAATAAAAP